MFTFILVTWSPSHSPTNLPTIHPLLFPFFSFTCSAGTTEEPERPLSSVLQSFSISALLPLHTGWFLATIPNLVGYLAVSLDSILQHQYRDTRCDTITYSRHIVSDWKPLLSVLLHILIKCQFFTNLPWLHIPSFCLCLFWFGTLDSLIFYINLSFPLCLLFHPSVLNAVPQVNSWLLSHFFGVC